MADTDRPQETIDAAIDAAEPKFKGCWVDDDHEIVPIEIHGVTFRLRSMTVGEEIRIADELKMRWKFKRTGEKPEDIAIDLGDEMVIVVSEEKNKKVLTLCAALGAWTKYGSEGWSDSRELNAKNVEALEGGVLDKLYAEYVRHFRHF